MNNEIRDLMTMELDFVTGGATAQDVWACFVAAANHQPSTGNQPDPVTANKAHTTDVWDINGYGKEP